MKYTIEDRGHATPCWVWRQALTTEGYAQTVVRGQRHAAHRLFYEAHVGPIAEGKDLDHLCRVRACVNPEHLEVVTRAENVRRGASCKLSPADAAAIRRSKGSERASDLAERHGVSLRLVYAIWQGTVWADLR